VKPTVFTMPHVPYV